ncbi:acetyltransferase [Romboutsia sp. 1001713B170131_170501_G6]|uniref:acetyltransferase n=1 Tax=Romboutsia sp. 1001713B170131_170501_G6 TaxID=2787108 RepID=UPI0018AB1F67|nr:acetyltransferase [Romboutsia sp. 1001713B170131_170501_G6]
MKNIIVIGAGGHASVVIDIIECMKENGSQVQILGILDDRNDITKFRGYEILGKIRTENLYNRKDTEFIIGIGSNNIRKEIYRKYNHLKYFTAIHPSAIIGSHVNIKSGTVVMPRAIINSNTYIGKHVIINSGAIVEHDNIIGDFVHISPGTTLCGGVFVGESAHIGANSTVVPSKKIGANTIIGAGSTVITDIQFGVMAVGSPAKKIKDI